MMPIIKTVDIAVADVPNKNGRIYSRAILDDLVSKHGQSSILGMVGAPANGLLQVDLERVSHVVENLRMVGDILTAEVKTLDTPMGKILHTLLDNNVTLFFRLSGRAQLSPHLGVTSVTNYTLISIDAVSHGA